MADITAAMVKDLREKTGVGMMDCKTALAATNGDMEAAIDWLRAKGLAKAAKKSTRVAAEGLDFGMASPTRYVEAMAKAGFVNVETISRNAWYRERAKNEIAELRGPLYADAVRDLGIDPARSWVIGDKWLDVNLGHAVGARSILVRTGWGSDQG